MDDSGSNPFSLLATSSGMDLHPPVDSHDPWMHRTVAHAHNGSASVGNSLALSCQDPGDAAEKLLPTPTQKGTSLGDRTKLYQRPQAGASGLKGREIFYLHK